jgi:subtilisin family serine protease
MTTRIVTRYALLTALVCLGLAGTASGVYTGKIGTIGNQAPDVAMLTVVGHFDRPTTPDVSTAFTARDDWSLTAGWAPSFAPYLWDVGKVKLGQEFRLEDQGQMPTGRCTLIGAGYAWGPYDGFTGQPASGFTSTGMYYRSTMPVDVGLNGSFNLDYARQWKPCYTMKLGYSFERCELNLLRTAQPLASGGTQGVVAPASQDMASQWAFKKLGLPLGLRRQSLKPVVVAVIDSGLDYRHPHLKPENIWRNPKPGADPKFAGDLIGWNFVGNDNKPWDDYGHGTFVAGLITAINPAAQIMSLKVLDEFGNGPISAIAQAVVYAVDRGARIINLSIGSKGLSEAEELVVDYARARGAIVVVAAGNEGIDTAKFGPTAASGVFAVAATDQNDKRPPFGNWGQQIALAAPGVDIVSLRARATDFVLIATRGKDYTRGANVVGADRSLFRASGTSFSAPLVAGAASLLMSSNPALTKEQVERMLVESADDIETPGWDQYTGAGRLNIARALKADPAYYLTAKVSRVEAGRLAGQTVVNVFGTADGSDFKDYEIQLGQGEAPSRWRTIGGRNRIAVEDHVLASIPIKEITARGHWAIRLVVTDGSKTKEARGSLNVQ